MNNNNKGAIKNDEEKKYRMEMIKYMECIIGWKRVQRCNETLPSPCLPRNRSEWHPLPRPGTSWRIAWRTCRCVENLPGKWRRRGRERGRPADPAGWPWHRPSAARQSTAPSPPPARSDWTWCTWPGTGGTRTRPLHPIPHPKPRIKNVPSTKSWPMVYWKKPFDVVYWQCTFANCMQSWSFSA